ncbi:hypothetical protein KFK09_020669 [Dendrobium nobile]|uniref:Uncharacterized protein n=1 Tax=Dendrobium nobile TaxID=94219 RepID=A0A8T3ANT9_DENNO|nr:hypothetical protein KFK09_020669 [Dendrobium nobile]
MAKLKEIGLTRRDRAFFFILFLLLQLQAGRSSNDVIDELGRMRARLGVSLSPSLLPNGRHGGGAQREGKMFGNEKRNVYTGPNPLHNR